MDRIDFWKNFKLGEELDISGRFIYNGLRYFHEMETLYHEGEIFEVLYNLSVGLERLLKVTVILIEHDDTTDQEEFEKSLITHSHLDLLKRVQKKCTLSIAGPHKEFMQMLSVFYKTHRYGRYGIAAMKAQGEEKSAFHEYLKKHLKIEVSDEPPVFITKNSERIKKFIGKIIGKITSELYEIIQQSAAKLNIYTYELRWDSKAAKIYLRKEYDFIREDVLWRELLLYLMNTNEKSGQLGFMKELDPLEFDPGLVVEYLQCFGSDEKKLSNMDELEELYQELANPGERLEAIRLIGDSSVYFEDEDEDES